MNDFLKDVIEHRKNKYKNLSIDIVKVFQVAIDKYEKYYKILDSQLLFYITATLYPCTRAKCLDNHLSHEESEYIQNEINARIKRDYILDSNNSIDQYSLSTPDSASTPIHDTLLYMLAELPSQSDSDLDIFYSGPCTKFEENSTIEWALQWNQQKS